MTGPPNDDLSLVVLAQIAISVFLGLLFSAAVYWLLSLL